MTNPVGLARKASRAKALREDAALLAALPDLTDAVRAFLAAGLMLDPWLAGLGGEHVTFNSQDLLHRAAEGLASEHWREPTISRTLHELPAVRGLGHKAVLEIAMSTAVALGHEQFGRAYVDLGTANQAVDRIEAFIRGQGFGALVWVYLAVALLENHLALAHYGALREDEFASGVHHRPWVQTPLDDELVLGVAWGAYRLRVRNDRRWVELTPAGRDLYAAIRRMLAESGYLAERMRLINLSQFNLAEAGDASLIAPGYGDQRAAFTAFAGLRPGMRVLELGCGMGTQTFEGGLWQAVGPDGSLVCLDPAVGMLRRAERRAEEREARNIRFVQGRGEALPFADASFDAVVGFQFLEFTDARRTLAEMARVVKPGGVLAVGGACQLTLDLPWFRDWFLPIFTVAEEHALAVKSPYYDPGRIPDLFPEGRCQHMQVVYRDAWGRLEEAEAAVHLLVHGASFFQEILEVLPWRARQELIEDLKARGRAVCARTSPEERTVTFPVEFVRATT
jgi:SAM-dependent methyltransferase